jgi:hypothetical protein
MFSWAMIKGDSTNGVLVLGGMTPADPGSTLIARKAAAKATAGPSAGFGAFHAPKLAQDDSLFLLLRQSLLRMTIFCCSGLQREE